MCGRIFQTHNLQRLIEISRNSRVRNSDRHTTSYNIAPTSYIPAVRNIRNSSSNSNEKEEEKIENDEQKETNESNNELNFLKWGYDAGFAFVINARVEELQEKKMFKNLLNTNRCAVIVEGYYEWDPKKTPYSHKSKTNDYFFIAALYAKDDSIILLTRQSNKELEHIHHRMPVLLDENELKLWLDVKNNSFSSIIDKYILNENNPIWKTVEFQVIGPYINNVKNKSKDCLISKEDYIKKLDQNGIKKFFKPKGQEEKTNDKIVIVQKEKKINDIKNEEKLQNSKKIKTNLNVC